MLRRLMRRNSPGIDAKWDRRLDVSFALLVAVVALAFSLHGATGKAVEHVSCFLRLSNSWIENTVRWFMGWPAGLKLNTELDSFLGGHFLFVSGTWGRVAGFIFPSSPVAHSVAAVAFLFATAPLGLSGQLCLAADGIWVAFAHVVAFGAGVASIHSAMLRSLVALWRLFRGWKWNPLKRRVDTCEYSLDELLVGTIAFAVVCFLWPTVAVFHVFFASLSVAISAARRVAFAAAVCLRSWPSATLAVRLLRPSNLPAWKPFIEVPACGRVIERIEPPSYSSLFDPLRAEFTEWFKGNPVSSSVLFILSGN